MTPEQAQELLETLRKFQYEAKPADFTRIFGPDLGTHLWRKFCDVYDHNPLSFYFSLDTQNAERFARQVYCWYPGQTELMESLR